MPKIITHIAVTESVRSVPGVGGLPPQNVVYLDYWFVLPQNTICHHQASEDGGKTWVPFGADKATFGAPWPPVLTANEPKEPVAPSVARLHRWVDLLAPDPVA